MSQVKFPDANASGTHSPQVAYSLYHWATEPLPYTGEILWLKWCLKYGLNDYKFMSHCIHI